MSDDDVLVIGDTPLGRLPTDRRRPDLITAPLVLYCKTPRTVSEVKRWAIAGGIRPPRAKVTADYVHGYLTNALRGGYLRHATAAERAARDTGSAAEAAPATLPIGPTPPPSVPGQADRRSEPTESIPVGGGFGTPDANAEVEKAAVDLVTERRRGGVPTELSKLAHRPRAA